MTNEEFVSFACPHSWFLVADDLHEQAVQIVTRLGESKTSRVDLISRIEFVRDASNRSAFLLAAFALENLIKAFLVYENPGWISNGTLAGKLKSHDLTALAKISNLLPDVAESSEVLELIQDGNQSWARYPCGLDKATTVDPGEMHSDLWLRYLELMKVYARKLIELLSKEWKGPHGFKGYYKMEGEFIGVVCE